jgi:hypothetical protein
MDSVPVIVRQVTVHFQERTKERFIPRRAKKLWARAQSSAAK